MDITLLAVIGLVVLLLIGIAFFIFMVNDVKKSPMTEYEIYGEQGEHEWERQAIGMTEEKYEKFLKMEDVTHTTETTLQQPDVMRSVLADLQSQLESSRQLSPPLDYSEGQWREGMECGLETAIQILEDALTKHFS
jgi:uncharacterized membrane-anchored protein YhcB (DUF1043 family)